MKKIVIATLSVVAIILFTWSIAEQINENRIINNLNLNYLCFYAYDKDTNKKIDTTCRIETIFGADSESQRYSSLPCVISTPTGGPFQILLIGVGMPTNKYFVRFDGYQKSQVILRQQQTGSSFSGSLAEIIYFKKLE